VLPAPPILDTLQSQNEKVYNEMLSEQQQLQQMSLVSHLVLEIVDNGTFLAIDGTFSGFWGFRIEFTFTGLALDISPRSPVTVDQSRFVVNQRYLL
jgi:hypothetical protein